jgi:hypothetical protein
MIKHLAWAFILFQSMAVAHAGSYDFPTIKEKDLPSELLHAYAQEKGNLGEIGRCAVSFDSTSDQDKMVISCSIYVKMSAVAARHAVERCEAQSREKRIQDKCKVIER